MWARSRVLWIGFTALAGLGMLAAKERAADVPEGGASIDQLWVEPDDIASRDLFHGAGGKEGVPPDVAYQFKDEDKTGHSGGYDVLDPEGRKWDVKIGEEAQSEVAVSRLLWAIGYHQPVVYYVAEWRMSGGPTARPAPGRFRLESDHHTRGNWSWHENPFEGTRPYNGLIVANLLVNNWDVDTSQNRIYEPKKRARGPSRRFVVQDVGGSLGKTRWPLGTRNNIDDFESQDFVLGVENGHVKFDYHARHRRLLKDITPEDVVWTCRWFAKLTNRQLEDAFRGAGYPDAIAERYIHKLQQKVQQGLALDAKPGGRQ